MNLNKLRLNDTLYSLKNRRINEFIVASISVTSGVDEEVYETYTVKCTHEECGQCIDVYIDNNRLIPSGDHTCWHVGGELFASKKPILNFVKKGIKERYKAISEKLIDYEAKLKSVVEAINAAPKDEVVPKAGDKVYGFNGYTYTVLDVVETFGTRVLKLECDSCSHGFACVIHVFNQQKRDPNLYGYLSIGRDDYYFHHMGYTYYSSKESYDLASLRREKEMYEGYIESLKDKKT